MDVKIKSKAARQRMVADFNRHFPVGTRVRLRTDSGEVETVVRGEATLLNGHSAVAWFDNVRGAYSIDGRVRAGAGPLLTFHHGDES